MLLSTSLAWLFGFSTEGMMAPQQTRRELRRRPPAHSSLRGEIVSFEVVEKNVTSEIAYVVELERMRGKFGGREEIAPYDLRATMIFRPEGATWKVVHRHADQIPATETMT